MNDPTTASRPKLAVHKFSSCDGCQLAFLNLGEALVELARLFDIRHFAEAGVLDEEAPVDVAFVEGSVSVPEDLARLRRIRERSRFLVAIGACATSGGIQALRRLHDLDALRGAVYPRPAWIASLAHATPPSRHVKVDLELGGCPVDAGQVLDVLGDLRAGIRPQARDEPLCQQCKRRGVTCVMVAAGEPCLGPVTRAGCGALCPALGRACYACYGPVGQPNAPSLEGRLAELGLDPAARARRFRYLHSGVAAFESTAQRALWDTAEPKRGDDGR